MQILQLQKHQAVLNQLTTLQNSKQVVTWKITEENLLVFPYKFTTKKLKKKQKSLLLRNLEKSIEVLDTLKEIWDVTNDTGNSVIKVLFLDNQNPILTKIEWSSTGKKFQLQVLTIQSVHWILNIQKMMGNTYLEINVKNEGIDTAKIRSQIETVSFSENVPIYVSEVESNYQLNSKTKEYVQKVIYDSFIGCEVIDEMFCDEETDYWFTPMRIIFWLTENLE